MKTGGRPLWKEDKYHSWAGRDAGKKALPVQTQGHLPASRQGRPDGGVFRATDLLGRAEAEEEGRHSHGDGDLAPRRQHGVA